MNCWSVELHTISWICILSHLVNVCVCAAYTVLLETYIGPHHWQKWRWLDVGCSCLGLLRIITKKLQSEMYIKRQYSSQHHNNAKQRRHFGCLLSNLYIKVFPCFPPGRYWSCSCAWASVHHTDGLDSFSSGVGCWLDWGPHQPSLASGVRQGVPCLWALGREVLIADQWVRKWGLWCEGMSI